MSKSITELREQTIRSLDNAQDKTIFINNNAQSLYNLGLTMYSKDNCLDSLIFNSITMSQLNPNISLHEDQWKALKLLEENEGLILSAPTSFGKTFVVFEYIARYYPKNVFLVVPTLALVDEYKQKIIKEYKDVFDRYKIYITLSEAAFTNENDYNMFIVTHDKVVEYGSVENINDIDLLVIDEVYKLDAKLQDDRKLILNIAYYQLVQRSKKHLLLAPFISGITNIDKLAKHPKFFKTDFSPVVNEVIVCNISDNTELDRFNAVSDIVNTKIKDGEKTLIYFSNATNIPKYGKIYPKNNFDWKNSNTEISEFIDWATNEIHPDWYLVKCLKNGYLIHSGELSVGIRNLMLDVFNKGDEKYNIILGTSTLLEGVNTSTKNIIISKPSRAHSYSLTRGFSNDFEAFDFFNLIGRSGRMFKHYLGTAYYVKAPTDREYFKEEAIKDIEFEITTDSLDMQIQLKECTSQEYIELLEELNCTEDEYLENTSFMNYKKIKSLLVNYKKLKNILYSTINQYYLLKERASIVPIIYHLLSIIQNRISFNKDKYINYLAVIVRDCINKKRLSVKEIVSDVNAIAIDNYFSKSLDEIISEVIKKKNSFIEFEFKKCLKVLAFFDNKIGDSTLKNFINSELLSRIDYIYYLDNPRKRLLKELGIYEKDIDTLSEFINDDNINVSEVIIILKNKYNEYVNKISFISKYVINRL